MPQAAATAGPWDDFAPAAAAAAPPIADAPPVDGGAPQLSLAQRNAMLADKVRDPNASEADVLNLAQSLGLSITGHLKENLHNPRARVVSPDTVAAGPWDDFRAPPPPPPPSWGDYAREFGDNLVHDVAGIGKGAAGIVDLPARGLGWAMGKVSSALGAPDWVTENLSHPATIEGGIERVVKPKTDTAGQYSEAISRGVGGLFSGWGAGKALLDMGSPVAQRVGDVLLSNRGMQTVGAATGSAGAEAARQAGAPPLVQLGAGLLAGGGVPAALHGGDNLLDLLIGRVRGRADVINDAAGQFIRGNSTNPIEDDLASLRAYEPPASGAKPTLAEVTLDPGHASMQRGVANISANAGARITRQVNANAQNRMDAIDHALGVGDPTAIPQAAAAADSALAARSSASVDKVGPMVPPDEAGSQARSALLSGYQGARGRTAAAYDHPALNDNPPVRLRPYDPEDVTVPTVPDTRPLASFQEEAVRMSRSALPPPPKTLLQFVRSKGGISSADNYAGDFQAEGMGAKGQPGLVTRRGRPLDDLREAAVEAGFVPEHTSLADFADLLTGEYRGTTAPRHAAADVNAALEHDQAREARDWWRQQFDDRNLDPTKMSEEEWVRFYNDVEGQRTDSPRALDDLRHESGPGKPMGPFQSTIMALRDRYFGDGGREAPPAARGFFNDVINADEVGLKTLEGWERTARDLAAIAPDRTTAAFLKTVGDAIGAKAAMEAGPERRAALDAARGVRRQQGDTFETGAVGNALGRADYGRYRLPDSEVGRVLVPPGRSGGVVADQLKAAAPTDAEGIARAEVRRALDDAGGDPRRIAAVAGKYREAIGRFPSLQSDVEAARHDAAVAARFRSTQLGSFLDANSSPSAAVARLLTLKDGGAAFRSLVTAEPMTPAALAGVRRAAAEHVRDSSLTAVVDEDLRNVPASRKMQDGIQALLERTRDTRVLTAGQRQVLRSLGRELQADQFARSANRPSGSDTARNVGLAMRLTQTAFETLPKAGHLRTLAQVVSRLGFKTEQVMDVVAQAVEDPKFAAMLLQRPTGQRLERFLRASRAFTLGATEGAGASARQPPANVQQVSGGDQGGNGDEDQRHQ